jgi:hypothetical protein
MSASANGIHARTRFHAIPLCSVEPVYRIRNAIIATANSERIASEAITASRRSLNERRR